MTRDEKIAAAKAELFEAERRYGAASYDCAQDLSKPSMPYEIFTNITKARKALAEAEKPERPRLMAVHDRACQTASCYAGYSPLVVASHAIRDDRADIAAKVRQLRIRGTVDGRSMIALHDTLDLLEGK